MSGTEDLPGLLADRNIRLKSLRPGHNEKLICPKCHGGKTREQSLSVTINPEGDGFACKCHRGNCGYVDGARVKSAQGRPVVRKAPPPPQAPPQHALGAEIRNAALYGFFANRGIGQETVDAFGCYQTRHWFPGEGEQIGTVFPYRWRGKLVNRKYRSPAKMFVQEKNPLPTLFNIDAVQAPDVVAWCEGEADVMAMHEVGYPQTVSLANGAPAELRPEDDPRRQDDKRFAALATHADLLGTIKKFILAVDQDGPGEVLREELARRLGRHRCWIVTWPPGCKDACDVLKAHGPAGVQRAVEAAEPYPIEGLQRIRTGTLTALRRLPAPAILTTGTRASDEVLKLPGEGRLIVVTGYPSSGKTSWLRFVMVHTAIDHRRKWVVFSPESQPWEQFAAQCAEVYVGRPFYRERDRAAMTDEEVQEAEAWLSDRVTMLVCDAEDQAPTLDWILERARVAVLQTGCTDLVIDPWNEVQHERRDMSETDYTGFALQRLKAFGLRHGVNVWAAVHPRIPPPLKPGETRAAPGPYDCSGSAHFANKADLGITIHSPEPPFTQLHLWKARFRRWGQKNQMAQMEYEPSSGRYRTRDAPIVDGVGIVSDAIRGSW